MFWAFGSLLFLQVSTAHVSLCLCSSTSLHPVCGQLAPPAFVQRLGQAPISSAFYSSSQTFPSWLVAFSMLWDFLCVAGGGASFLRRTESLRPEALRVWAEGWGGNPGLRVWELFSSRPSPSHHPPPASQCSFPQSQDALSSISPLHLGLCTRDPPAPLAWGASRICDVCAQLLRTPCQQSSHSW